MTPQLLTSLLPILTSGINNMSSPRHPTVFTEPVLQNLLSLFIESSQFGKFDLAFPSDVLQVIVDQNDYLDLAGQACLLLSLQKNGEQYLTEPLIERLLFLADFNQLITESDPEASVESLQQISLFAFLALIKLTNYKQGCELATALDALPAIIKQLKNGVYEPKQTALACLANLLSTDQKENHAYLVKSNGVMLLCELINDEEDDEISDRAYVCLKKLGMLAIDQLIKNLHSILSQRDYNWNERNSIIIDVLDGTERHLCTLKDVAAVPNFRDFGIQDQNDLIDQRHLGTLEKLLPVLNGLLLETDATEVLRNQEMLRTLFSVFRYQIPIDLHENALLISLNLLQRANKALRQEIATNMLKSMFKFLNDLQSIEREVLQNHIDGQPVEEHLTVFVDYRLEYNPTFKSKKAVSIEDMQMKRLTQSMLLWKPTEKGTFSVDRKDPSSHTKVRARDELVKKSVVRHV